MSTLPVHNSGSGTAAAAIGASKSPQHAGRRTLPPLNHRVDRAGGRSRLLKSPRAQDASQALETGALLALIRDFPRMIEPHGGLSYPLADRRRAGLGSENKTGETWKVHSRLMQRITPELHTSWQLARQQAYLQLQSAVLESYLRVEETRHQLDELLVLERKLFEKLRGREQTGKFYPHPLGNIAPAMDSVCDASSVLNQLRSVCNDNPSLALEKHDLWMRLLPTRQVLLRSAVHCVEQGRSLLEWRLRVLVVLRDKKDEGKQWRQCVYVSMQYVEQFNRQCQHWERAFADLLRDNGVSIQSECFKPISFACFVSSVSSTFAEQLGMQIASSVYDDFWEKTAARLPNREDRDNAHNDSLLALDRSAIVFAAEVVSIASCLPVLFSRWSPSTNEGMDDGKLKDQVFALIDRVLAAVYDELVAEQTRVEKHTTNKRKSTPPVWNTSSGRSSQAGNTSTRSPAADMVPRPAQHIMQVMVLHLTVAMVQPAANTLRRHFAAQLDGRIARRLVQLSWLSNLRTDGNIPRSDSLRPVSRAWDTLLTWLELQHLRHLTDRGLSQAVVRNTELTSRLKLNVATSWSHALLPAVYEMTRQRDNSAAEDSPLSTVQLFFRRHDIRTTTAAVEGAIGPADPGTSEGVKFSNFATVHHECLESLMNQALSCVDRRHPAYNLLSSSVAARRFSCNLHQLSMQVIQHVDRSMHGLLITLFNDGTLPPLLVTVHSDLPWIAHALQRTVTGLHGSGSEQHTMIMGRQQLNEIGEAVRSYAAAVGKAQSEFDGLLQRASLTFWSDALPAKETWKKSPRGVKQWKSGPYIQSSIGSLLTPCVDALLGQPLEGQRRGMILVLENLLQSLESQIQQTSGIKFSAHGARQMEADIDTLKSWLVMPESHLDSVVGRAVAGAQVFGRWQRNLSLLSWQPGTNYSSDFAPQGVDRLLPAAPAQRGSAFSAPHRNRIAPMPMAEETDGGRQSSPGDDEKDREWLKYRLHGEAKAKSRACVIL